MAARKKRKKKNKTGLFFMTLAATVIPGIAFLMVCWTLQEIKSMPVSATAAQGETANLEGEGVRAAGMIQESETSAGALEGNMGDAAADNGFPAGGDVEDPTQGEPASGKYGDILADPEAMARDNIHVVVPASPNEVTLTFAGDILFDGDYSIMAKMKNRAGEAMENYVETAFDEPMRNAMRSADIFMVNNEFTYTNRGAPTEDKKFTFRARPEHASLLLDMGADIVSLANNHTYDYGEISLLDTLDTLTAIGMPYVGAGRNLAEAVRPVYFIAGDVKIAFLSATQIERMDNPSTRGATENSAGVFRCRNVDLLLEKVTEAKAVSDYVVVYIHWGTESTTELDWAQKEQAPKIAEAGADLIIGDHPHVLQGIGWCGQTPVIYSLGNYLFNSKTQDTCLITVTLDTHTGERKSVRFIPALQQDCRTVMHMGVEKQRVIQNMREMSPESLIDEEGYVTKAQG